MEVNGDMTMGEMVEEIYKSLTTGVTHATKIGTLTGDGSIDISSKYPNYRQFTIENFLIVITKIPDAYSNGCSQNTGACARAVGTVPTKAYDASTGVLTVTGLSQPIQVLWVGNMQPMADGTQTFTADIYAI